MGVCTVGPRPSAEMLRGLRCRSRVRGGRLFPPQASSTPHSDEPEQLTHLRVKDKTRKPLGRNRNKVLGQRFPQFLGPQSTNLDRKT